MERFVHKSGDSKYCNFLNRSAMDIFLQVLQLSLNSMSKSEYILGQKTCSFKNCMYLKLAYFLYHNLIFFSGKNY